MSMLMLCTYPPACAHMDRFENQTCRGRVGRRIGHGHEDFMFRPKSGSDMKESCMPDLTTENKDQLVRPKMSDWSKGVLIQNANHNAQRLYRVIRLHSLEEASKMIQ